MDHPEAIAMKAAERYVLGDLSVSEVEEFERHFFDCPQCSEELRLLSVLQENARAVFIEQSPGPRPEPVVQPVPAPAPAPIPVVEKESWWKAWTRPLVLAPALAAIAVAVLIGYQTGSQKSGEPQAISSFPIYAASRGEETVVAPAANAQFYSLYMDRTWDRDFPSYTAALRAEGSDAVRFSMPVAGVAPGQSIQVLLPIHTLEAGRYVLTISGNDGTALARYPFTLRFH